MKLLLVQLTRNKQGQLMRAQQTLVVDQLRIGRGTDCNLLLADPRVALHHAVIGTGGTLVGTHNFGFIEASNGVITVDGAFERAAKLKPGQRIGIGPFEIAVLEREAGADYDLALSWELIEPAVESTEEAKKSVKIGMRNTWLSKRWMSWVSIVAILAAFLAWPVMSALNNQKLRNTDVVREAKPFLTADASWNPGELATSHHSFGRDCVQCHTTPFKHTPNEACESCHKIIGWHFERNTKEAKAMHAAVFEKPGEETRCASCHRDHKGPMGLIRQDSPLCTDCHGNLKAQLPKTSSPDITDFQKDHPQFRLSMLVPGKTGPEAIDRVFQDTPKLVEKSNLKFPHDVHLNKQGVRGQNGKRVMECKNCHVPDETGSRFKPATMKDHCQECHSLEFEPRATNRQVPHGNVEDVIATVNEFYSQAVLADTPIDVVFNEGARRPGERLNVADPAKRLAALAWATKKADTITRELMEVRVCFSCHEIKRETVGEGKQETVTWRVAPIAVTQHWLPKSRFPHVQHNPYECKQCHSVEGSKKSGDIAIPDIKNCQGCHAGNVVTTDMVRGTCETCHGFHVGGSKSGVPVPFPGALPGDPKERAAQKVAKLAGSAHP
jgi:predicted CXXCH cytochrome family protein